MLPAVDPDAGFLFGRDGRVGDMHQLQRTAFVTQPDGVECHVRPCRPGLEAFLQITVGIGLIQGEEHRVAGEVFVEQEPVRFPQREMGPVLAVVGIGGARDAVVHAGQVDLFSLDAGHPEIIPVGTGIKRCVHGILRVETAVDGVGEAGQAFFVRQPDAAAVDPFHFAQGAGFEIRVEADSVFRRASRRQQCQAAEDAGQKGFCSFHNLISLREMNDSGRGIS